jgi:hypothetical protein
MVDLAQFVSDYVAIESTSPITVDEIADAYEDHGGEPIDRKDLVAQIKYYLGV